MLVPLLQTLAQRHPVEPWTWFLVMLGLFILFFVVYSVIVLLYHGRGY